MSSTTKEINKVTGTIISVASKFIIYVLVILLLYEGITKGYAFGHEIFYSSGLAAEPGIEKQITITGGETIGEVADALEDMGLIQNEYAFQIQSNFYEYEIVPGTYTLNNSMSSKTIILLLKE
ncbi:MAG: aminodeoxychorismate lyase, partial [Hungatella sp.]